MSNNNTGNAVPSTDPRDLDDNATVFDFLLMSTEASVPDRLGEQRKTWHQMELDAEGLVSPNVAALAAAVADANKGIYFSAGSPAAISTYDLTAFVRGLGVNATSSAFRTAIGAMALTDTGAFAGSAAKLGAARTIAASGDITWSVNFDGSANVTAASALSTTGVAAGTYGTVTVDAKGRATAGNTLTPIANGGTNASTAAVARTNLGAAASGANADITSLSRGAPAVKTADFTVTASDSWLFCNGAAAITVTLPAAASFPGRELMIKTIAAQAVNSASANIAPLVGGALSASILTAAAGKWATLVSNGANWVIMQAN